MKPSGLSKHKKLKWIALILLLLTVMASIAAIGWIMWQNHRRVRQYQEAVRKFETGENEAALQLLLRCLAEDPNNEAAAVRTAEILERLNLWRDAAWYWEYAEKLNAFKPEYEKAKLRTLLLSGDFPALIRAQEFRGNKLTPEEKLQLTLALLKTGKREIARENFDKLRKNAVLLDSPLGQLLEFYFSAEKLTPEQMRKRLETLATSADPTVQFDALTLLAGLARATGDAPKAEAACRRAVEINPIAGKPLLAEFYFQNRDYDKAIESYQDLLKNRNLPYFAMRLGDALTIRGRSAEIRELARRYRNGGREILVAGYYLEALAAFLEHDEAVLAANLSLLKDEPVGALMLRIMLYSAARSGDVEEACRLLQRLTPFETPEQRDDILRICAPLLAQCLKNQENQAAARLARLLQDPAKPDLLLTQTILADELQENSITIEMIARALSHFPGDPVLLDIAANNALRNRRFDAALKYATENYAGRGKTPQIRLQAAAAYEGMGEIDKAAALLAELIEQNPQDRALFTRRFLFDIRYRRMEDLARLDTELQQAATPEIRQLLPFVQLELAGKGSSPEVRRALLQKIAAARPEPDTPENLELLYREAFQLAQLDQIDDAIARYQAIAARYPIPGLVLVNLSELYAARGDKAAALESAAEAWKLTAPWPPAVECYGLRLAESGNDEQAIRLLTPLLAARQQLPRVLPAWTGAMENEIRRTFDAKHETECRELAAKLLAEVPDNPVAVEFLRRTELRRTGQPK